jgi:hypothetical protein
MSDRRIELPIRVALGCTLLASAACDPKLVGSCTEPHCVLEADCEASEQHLPDGCDLDAGSCDGKVIEDAPACDECEQTRSRLRIRSAGRELHLQCACRSCAVQVMACVASARPDSGEPDGGDAERDDLCRDMVECSLAFGCSGTECYCGEGVDQVTCLSNANSDGGTMGPCARTVTAAGGCLGDPSPGDCVLRQRNDPSTAIGRAVAVGSCTTGDPIVGDEGVCPFEAVSGPPSASTTSSQR